MDNEPSASQRPESFHPAYSRAVKMVVFSVEGKGFMIDAARLAQHSPFLEDMFYGAGIGIANEGSENHPIVIEGCTSEAFANFFGWMDHNPWAPILADRAQQVLDILHISHMWEIKPGIDFAVAELLNPQFGLRPAHRLHLAHRYGIRAWIPVAVRKLLATPLKQYTVVDKEYLGFNLYEVIATTKEAIDTERKRLGVHPPYPKSFDDAPFCDQHANCMKIWVERWYVEILRRIHHLSEPLPISSIVKALEETDHKGMKKGCKEYILTWLRGSNHLGKEDELIQDAIDSVHRLFT